MATTYTIDIFSSLDGFGSYGPGGDWGGYWGKQGPELLEHRARQLAEPQRMVLGATTFREFVQMLGSADDGSEVRDAWVTRMVHLPATVVSSTLVEPLDWPDATVATGDGVEVVRRLKEESDVPLRSHGSLSLNRALLDAGLVDRLQVTTFPVLTGRSGTGRIFEGIGDFDLELLDSHVLDGRTVESVYRPTVHRSASAG
ncbi:dihydrofolate reductase family protein [Ornithinimicrobium tianjinense]|uniref:Deaminase reductase n=1 Tax=Ornithinimicrobium tianjinense TaxID=1195761 RepID=A0A917BS38_9MICO|nr:dihydrofolate reductase family protein [Ornithinimicrobium tianjinense]GGF54347.1 deaminase reductase [Ornithinimicrobium tianjinense]